MAIALLIAIAVIVVCKLKVLPKKCPTINKIVDIFKSKLMFNSVLRILLQTYLALSLSTGLQIKDSRDLTSQDIWSVVAVLMLLLLFPIYSLVFLLKR